ncbi:MAG: outer membrane lipoprotein carrier protein LolA [Gemmatimonadaceae bacterium]|nr:outer membrane lipoprotein carrier protein LolA [Gemmatimonadaceae bacterium]
MTAPFTQLRYAVPTVLLMVGTATRVAAQPAADAAYDRAAKAWASHNTLEARFDQKIVNTLIGRTALSKGTFLQQKPNRVSITFTDPVGDRIVGDGRSLWVYLPSSAPGQVMKLPADADGAVVADLLGQLLDTPKRAFTITGGDAATVEGRRTKRVLLVPKDANTVPFQKATLWIDDTEPRPVRVQVIDAQGVDRTITLTSWTPNATLPKDAFVFTPPKGAKIITKIPGT